jgi:hypothetical protein
MVDPHPRLVRVAAMIAGVGVVIAALFGLGRLVVGEWGAFSQVTCESLSVLCPDDRVLAREELEISELAGPSVILYATPYVEFTRAHWAKGPKDRTCKEPKVPQGYRLVKYGSLKRVEGQGECQIGEYCDGGKNEYCEDFVVTIACFINDEHFKLMEPILSGEPTEQDIKTVCGLAGDS